MNLGVSKSNKNQALLDEAARYCDFGQLAEAERSCRRVLRAQPSNPRANLMLGEILRNQDRDAEAEALLRRVVAVAPDLADGHNLLGSVLYKQGKLQEAEGSFQRALALNPVTPDAIRRLAGVLFDQGRFAESIPWFRRQAELEWGIDARAAVGREPTPAHKALHDKEQLDYLKGCNLTPADAADVFYLDEGARVPGQAVKPDTSGGEISAKWQNRLPQLLVIDDLLTKEALERLRFFCLRSTVWHRAYKLGYVGTVPEYGFACPLIAQIAEDLRSVYPSVLRDYPLTRCWAFKCDSHLQGTGIHADFAAVNVNFWITPDEANLDADSGGLVVWDKPAPRDWDFEKFNNPGDAIQHFLRDSGSKSTTIPYRANRAVIFDSDLFHRTDRAAFKEGYLNRRINVTMLYGRREAAAN
jgi:Tetratricopeptide repeat